MVKANVDRILDILRQKKSTSISDLSHSLGLKKEDIQKSAEYLEQDGKIKIEHKWPKVVLTLNAETNLENQELQPPSLNQPPQVQNVQPQPQLIQQPVQQSTSQSKPKEPLPVPPLQKPQPQLNQPSLNQNPQVQNVQPQPQQTQQPIQHPTPQSKPKEPLPVPLLNNQIPKNPIQSYQITKPVNNNPNPIFSNTVANHPNLPPPPRPKHRTFQQENINYADKSKGEIFKATQQDSFQPFQNKDVDSEIPKADDFKAENDPLDPQTPMFNLAIPSPTGKETTPVFLESDNFSSKQIEFPSNIKEDMEKIEFLITQLNTKLNNHDYKNLNNFYRKLYMIYTESENMSSNEKYLLSEKINDVFERIKHVYTIEEIV